jgi:hypothetical protein
MHEQLKALYVERMNSETPQLFVIGWLHVLMRKSVVNLLSDWSGRPLKKSRGIAQRLVKLVPPIFDFDDDDMPIKIDQLIRNEFVKASPTEYIYNAPKTEDLFFHVDSRKLQKNQEPSKSSIDDDSEFLDAWLQQQYKTGNAEAGDGDSSEICLA